MLPATAIYFITCHGASADHFAIYSDEFKRRGYQVHIHATGPASKKLKELQVEVEYPFSIESLNPDEEDRLARGIAKTCSAASLVLTDVGHPFAIKIQKALAEYAVPRFAYYDNPEPFVPGGYSSTAAEVMQAANGVWFANKNLANSTIYHSLGKKLDLNSKLRFGIGYYPISPSKVIAERRNSEKASKRVSLFDKHKISDKGQKVCVYFGGNNEEYFSKAFPAFLSILSEASNKGDLKEKLIVVIQQHPGAKVSNHDASILKSWQEQLGNNDTLPRIILSDFSSEEAQLVADVACYYQTSMSPQFILAGIPTFQIGHERYSDILVRSGLAPSVISSAGLLSTLQNLDSSIKKTHQSLLKDLGIDPDWPIALQNIVKACLKPAIAPQTTAQGL